MDEARIAALEPDLAGRFHKGLFFAGEGHLDPRAALRALTERLRAHGADLRFGEDGDAAPAAGGDRHRLPRVSPRGPSCRTCAACAAR